VSAPGIAEVAVIGAGSTGLAVLRALRQQGLTVEGFEKGSDVGGVWRYENDNGLSGAYASLRTNVSRKRMEYPSFPMPVSDADFPGHAEMTAYLEAYAEENCLRQFIRFRTTIESMEPGRDGTWCLHVSNGSVRRYRAVVVAIGVFWCPRMPEYPGSFEGELLHSHDYRTPEPFAGRRVLVIGAGQSSAEIAVEVSGLAARTCMSIRGGAHVVPRWIGRRPYDSLDVAPFNRMSWRLLNYIYAFRASRELGSVPTSWPTPARRLLEGIPIVSSDLFPAIRRGKVMIKPAIDRLMVNGVRFGDGSEEPVDSIVCATGYRISLPFLSSTVALANGREFPLYRRIMPPNQVGLFFAGFVDAPGGLLPVVETQAEWIAAVLAGRLCLPAPDQMWRAMKAVERRTRQRFPAENSFSIRCDPHAYRRMLRSDLDRVS
jgi:dimethylaniline monooxygenase (N-oxide forming)